MRPATRLRVFSLHHKSTAAAAAAAAAVVKSKSSLSAQTTTEVVCDAHFAASDDYSSSHRLKPPIKKISKDERRSLLQAFVLQYKASNEGKFPSTTAARKQVGGSYYFVKRTLQELQSQPPPPSLNAASTSHSTTIEIQEEVSHARTTTAQTVVHLQPKCITKEEPTFQTPAPHVNAIPSTPLVQDVAQQTTNPHHDLQRNEHEDQLQKKSNIWRNLRSFADGILSLWSKK